MTPLTKKIIFALVFTMFLLLIIWYRLSIQNPTPPAPLITPTPDALPIDLSPTPTHIPTPNLTIAAIPIQRTGGDTIPTPTKLQSDEGSLLLRMPLSTPGLAMEFDYASDVFTVIIFTDAGEDEYHAIRKEYALSDSRFQIIDKRTRTQ